MATAPGPAPTWGGNTSSTSSGTAYLGDVPHARIPKTGPFGMAMGPLTQPGYYKGDQVKLLPKNGGDLASLQQALYQAGYLTDAQYSRIVLGSPDEVTSDAFAKLLASANMSGQSWMNTLGARLASAGQQAPAEKASKIPPLTITLDNPDDIKAVLQKSSQTLLGGNMDPAQADAFVASIQRQQRDAQTAAYYQQYTPTPGDPSTGTYGPGGETIAAPNAEGIQAQGEAALKYLNPAQYQTTQIGASLTSALDNLRSTGYF